MVHIIKPRKNREHTNYPGVNSNPFTVHFNDSYYPYNKKAFKEDRKAVSNVSINITIGVVITMLVLIISILVYAMYNSGSLYIN